VQRDRFELILLSLLETGHCSMTKLDGEHYATGVILPFVTRVCIKVKVKFLLRHGDVWGVFVLIHVFLTSVLIGDG
jgi:hypothetical protein